ncbi:MAG TPA: hypothetical protein VNT52_03120 [Acidimicrobiales bacterium]|nr:hypothetical protein [Acidimicrobiales bacterium]
MALLASACSGGGASKGSAGANPTLATDPPTTTTTNPYAVPATIDAVYVNRVLAGLDAQLGDVTRLLIRSGTFPEEAYDRLKAVYTDDQALQLKLDAFQSDLRRGFQDYKPSPGNKVTTVTRIITASASCIFVEVRRDYSAVALNSNVVNPQWTALKPSDPSRDPRRYNDTRWALAYDSVQPNLAQPPNPCGS